MERVFSPGELIRSIVVTPANKRALGCVKEGVFLNGVAVAVAKRYPKRAVLIRCSARQSAGNGSMMRRSSEKEIHWNARIQQSNPRPKHQSKHALPLDTDSPTIGQLPQPPIESVSPTYTPKTLLKPLCEIACESEHVTIDTSKLDELVDAMNSKPAPADEILTDQIKACFQANPGSCFITASFWKAG